jgi:hypothetical protein
MQEDIESEMDKILVLLLIALAFTVSIFGVILYYASNLEEDSSRLGPNPELPEGIAPLSFPYNITFSSKEFEVVQGESAGFRIYITMLVNETDATTEFSWNLNAHQDQSWDSSKPVPLEMIFNPNQPILNYRELETIVITIKTAEETPLGEYKVSLDVHASSAGTSFTSHRTLLITVIP